MNIYFSGVGGVGIGPLVEIALDAGNTVAGSDLASSPLTDQLRDRGVAVHVGQQDATNIAARHASHPIDLFVYTSALPADHPELVFARRHSIPTVKRDQLLERIIREKGLKLVAVAGTHGKTTTTALLIWSLKQLGVTASYSVGSTLSFGPSGMFDSAAEYFIYECDEYDRNFLAFYPYLSVITSLDYDHPDTYKNEHVYKDAFIQFMGQSTRTILWEKDVRYLRQPDIAATYEAYDESMDLSRFTLPGLHNRQNAFLVERSVQKLLEGAGTTLPPPQIKHLTSILNSFPGTGRRFEKLADNLYSDYGHHPSEIAATLQLARELSDHVVLVYQPHQNVRQHEILTLYENCMQAAEAIYWLPTYLSREDPALEVLTPKQLIGGLTNSEAAHTADMNEALWEVIQTARRGGKLVLCMGAGSIDTWVRQRLAATK